MPEFCFEEKSNVTIFGIRQRATHQRWNANREGENVLTFFKISWKVRKSKFLVVKIVEGLILDYFGDKIFGPNSMFLSVKTENQLFVRTSFFHIQIDAPFNKFACLMILPPDINSQINIFILIDWCSHRNYLLIILFSLQININKILIKQTKCINHHAIPSVRLFASFSI